MWKEEWVLEGRKVWSSLFRVWIPMEYPYWDDQEAVENIGERSGLEMKLGIIIEAMTLPRKHNIESDKVVLGTVCI